MTELWGTRRFERLHGPGGRTIACTVLALLVLTFSMTFAGRAVAESTLTDTVVVEAGPDPEGQILSALKQHNGLVFSNREPPTISAAFLARELMRNGARVVDTAPEEGDAEESKNGNGDKAQPLAGELAPLRLSRVVVNGDVVLNRRVVSRFVELDHVTIQGDFQCTDCEFRQRFALVNSHVEKAIRFNGAKFKDTLELQNTQAREGLSLHGVHVDRAVYLDSLKVEGKLDLARLRAPSIQAFDLCNPRVPGQKAIRSPAKNCELHALGMNLESDFILDNARLRRSVIENSRVGGDLRLKGAIFGEKSSLFATKVAGCLELENTRFGKGADLSDLSFGRLSTGGHDESDEQIWSNMSRYLRQSRFSAESYARIEDYFRNRGNPDLADYVYIERSSQERIRQLSGGSAVMNRLEQVLVGYGRRPYLAFLWSLAFVVIGTFVFAQKRMVLQDDSKPAPSYNPFWYSLDVFLPLTHLRAGELWTPVKDARLTWVYLRIHHLLGWILIPLGLAAVSGLVE